MPIFSNEWGFLCQRRLNDAQADLRTILDGPAQVERPFLEPAFGDTEIAALIKTLGEHLDVLLAFAVVRDVNLLAASNVLYSSAFAEIPRDAGQIAQLFEAPQRRPRSSLSHAQAYARYKRWILGDAVEAKATPRTPGGDNQYVEAFFTRHPVAGYFVDRACRQFVGNIRKACNRIAADLPAIRDVFFPDRAPVSLARIIPTGSDFHKGGQQVLILELTFADAPPQKLVYKPSDVEIDYRLVGRNDDRLQAFLQQHTDATYPRFTRSLAQILNGLCGDANRRGAQMVWDCSAGDVDARAGQLEIGTYRILPRNPGSRFVPGTEPLPIDTSYGYIEFLTHEPRLQIPFPSMDVDGAVARALEAAWPPNGSDWTSDDPGAVPALLYQWGQLMVLAYVAGVSDLHVQNRIVHGCKPYLIDLEESFKWYETLRGSYIPYDMGRQRQAIPDVIRCRIEDDPTKSVPLVEMPPGESGRLEFSNDQLYVRANGVIRRAMLEPDRPPPPRGHFQALFRGIAAAVRAVRDHDDVVTWLQQCEGVIVRHVAESTMAYSEQLWKYYRQLLEQQGSERLPVPIAADGIARTLSFLSARAIPGKILLWQNARPPRPASYLLDTAANNLRDFGNFDIPYYVRRVGETAVRNARGERVDLAAARNELETVLQANNPSQLSQLPELPTQYFREAMPASLVERLNGWQTPAEADFVAKLQTLVTTAFTAAHRTDLAGLRHHLAAGQQPQGAV